MIIVLIHSDTNCIDTYVVERRNFTIDYDVPIDKLNSYFKRDWKKSITRLKKTKSIILNSDVVEIMKSFGWQMLEVSHGNVIHIFE